MRFLKVFYAIALAIIPALLTPTLSHGSPLINGSVLNITGQGVVAATSLTFQCDQPGDAACVVAPAGRGDFAIGNSTGSFAQYNGTFGLITSINNAAEPLNTPVSLPNFISFDLNNGLSIELTFVPLGTDSVSTTCAGLVHCTPQSAALVSPNNPQGLSPFNLDQNALGTAAAFGIFGIVHSIDGTTANIGGLFTTQFTGLSPQQALTLALSGNAQSYSATLEISSVTAAVPEPATLWVTGVGLLGLASLVRKVRNGEIRDNDPFLRLRDERPQTR